MGQAQDVIEEILRREGSKFTNRAADKGGPTKYGITIATLSAWRGRDCSIADVENLTIEEARQIYTREYVERPGFDRINSPALQGFLVDSGVQHGVGRAVIWLQRALHLKEDGQLGPITLAQANAAPLRDLFGDLVALRLKFYGAIIAEDLERKRASQSGFNLQAENAGGWANRMAEFVRQMSML